MKQQENSTTTTTKRTKAREREREKTPFNDINNGYIDIKPHIHDGDSDNITKGLLLKSLIRGYNSGCVCVYDKKCSGSSAMLLVMLPKMP